jgi:transposase
MIAETRKLYARENTFLNDINHMAYALDSTTIDLCLQMFPWAKFRQNKGAVKMHTLLDLQGSIPTFIKITPGSVHDVNILDQMPIEAGAFYIMDKELGIQVDQTIKFTHQQSQLKYPAHLRRIKFYDREKDKTFIFLTNHFEIDATTIAGLYKERWKIELFFRWIKQHLKIKSFYGTSENAIHCQIWIAICT